MVTALIQLRLSSLDQEADFDLKHHYGKKVKSHLIFYNYIGTILDRN